MNGRYPVRRGRSIILAAVVAAGLAVISACGGGGSGAPAGTWATLGAQLNGTTGRAFHAAVKLDSGDVLLVGGQDGDGTPLSGTGYAERFRTALFGFDRETTFDATASFRIAPVATLVPDTPGAPFPTPDDLVIVGGQLDFGVGFVTATTAAASPLWLDPTGTPMGGGEYNQAETRTVAPEPVQIDDLATGLFPVPIQGAALVTDPTNGVVYMIGGRDGNTGFALADIRVYDPLVGTGGGFVDTTVALGTPRYGHTATLTQLGNILVAGGWDSTGTPLSSTELIAATGGPGTLSVSAGPNLEIPRAAHTATALNGGFDLLLFGGVTTGDALAGATVGHVAEQIDQVGGFLYGWTATPRIYHTATLINTSQVLIAGGLESAGAGGFIASDRAEIVDATGLTPTQSATGSLATPRFGHTATRLDDGTVIAAGGLSGWSTTPAALPAINSAERYFPERY